MPAEWKTPSARGPGGGSSGADPTLIPTGLSQINPQPPAGSLEHPGDHNGEDEKYVCVGEYQKSRQSRCCWHAEKTSK